MNKSEIARSNRLVVALISTALLVLYIFSIGDYFTRAPSDLMSRGVKVGVTELTSSRNNKAHLLTIVSPENDSILLAAADGKVTRLIEINYLGEVQNDIEINLDLSEASQISGFVGDNGKLCLFARHTTLDSYIIDIGEKAWHRDLLMDDAESFRSNGSLLIVEKPGGLYGYDFLRNLLTGPLVPGNTRYYDFDIDDGNYTIVSIADKESDRYDVIMTIGKKGFREAQTIPILSDSTDPIYRKLHDIRTDGNVVSLLFVMRDNRYGSNFITIMQIARDSGNLINRFQAQVPIQNSQYSLVDSTAESASFLFHRKTSFGYNLTNCRVSADDVVIFSDFTKTRPFSLESLVFKAGDWKSLVFSDFQKESRTIYYASNHPGLKKSTTRPSIKDIKRIAAAVVTNAIVALSLGAVILLLLSVLPVGLVIVLSRKIKSSRSVNLIICGIGAVIYTAQKLIIVYNMINKTGNYTFSAPLIGGDPAIYIVLILMSVISYGLISRYITSPSVQGKSVMELFLQFLVIDFIQFTLVFLIYSATTLMAGKF